MTEKILSDKGTHYFVDAAPALPGGPRRRVKIKRHLCVGGPHDKAWRSRGELMDDGLIDQYREYNNAGGRRAAYSMIFLHEDLLP